MTRHVRILISREDAFTLNMLVAVIRERLPETAHRGHILTSIFSEMLKELRQSVFEEATDVIEKQLELEVDRRSLFGRTGNVRATARAKNRKRRYIRKVPRLPDPVGSAQPSLPAPPGRAR